MNFCLVMVSMRLDRQFDRMVFLHNSPFADARIQLFPSVGYALFFLEKPVTHLYEITLFVRTGSKNSRDSGHVEV